MASLRPRGERSPGPGRRLPDPAVRRQRLPPRSPGHSPGTPPPPAGCPGALHASAWGHDIRFSTGMFLKASRPGWGWPGSRRRRCPHRQGKQQSPEHLHPQGQAVQLGILAGRRHGNRGRNGRRRRGRYRRGWNRRGRHQGDSSGGGRGNGGGGGSRSSRGDRWRRSRAGRSGGRSRRNGGRGERRGGLRRHATTSGHRYQASRARQA